MKELLILDEPETRGYAYSSHGEMIRRLGEGWRPATRRERFLFELRRPRLSIAGAIVGAAVWFIVVSVLDFVR